MLLFLPLNYGAGYSPTEIYLAQVQNKTPPAIYAQASKENTIDELLKEAKEAALTKPKSAAKLYIDIISSNNELSAERAIKEALFTHKRLVEMAYASATVDSALEICEYVIKNHSKSPNAPMAKLISGTLKWNQKYNNNDVEIGINRLNEAAKEGQLDVQIEAHYILGNIKSLSKNPIDILAAIRHYQTVIKIAPPDNIYSKNSKHNIQEIFKLNK
ncbi:hypothetical protein HYW20_00295 [Candidatus Woesearchaeota archaeon]|nr:hypothetical protein [Candidatus Woesearchaeota archaeon]